MLRNHRKLKKLHVIEKCTSTIGRVRFQAALKSSIKLSQELDGRLLDHVWLKEKH